MGSKVLLNVYDLSPSANNVLYNIGLGLHHSGVEIEGVEYSFAHGAGIFDQPPKEVPNAKFRESIAMGVFNGGSADVRRVLADLRDEFHGDAYHLLKRNCNHFANALCWALLRKTIPAHVNRLAEIGVCCGCLLPKKMLEDSPVHAPGDTSSSTGGGGGGRFQMFGTARNTSAPGPAFTGSGMKLGSDSGTSATTSSSSSSSSLSGFGTLARVTSGRSNEQRNATEDLTDRRERARQAAMARLEQQSQPMNTTNHVTTAAAAAAAEGSGYKES